MLILPSECNFALQRPFSARQTEVPLLYAGFSGEKILTVLMIKLEMHLPPGPV